MKSLIDSNQTEKAVKLFPRVYTTSQEWEEQILSFIQRNELDVNKRLYSDKKND